MFKCDFLSSGAKWGEITPKAYFTPYFVVFRLQLRVFRNSKKITWDKK